jgi:MFS family permease
MLGTTLPTPLYPSYAEMFHLSELITTVVFATYPVGVTAGLLLFGHWSDQLGRRPMLLAGLALSALSAVAFLLPSMLGWLFVGRLLSGLSAGVVTGTATAAIVDLLPNDRERASLLAAAVNMGGLGAGPLLAGLLAQYAPLPLRLCFIVDLVLVGISFCCILMLRDPVPRAEHPRLGIQRIRIPREIRPVFTRAAIAGFAGFAVLGLFSSVSPAFLGDLLHETNRAVVGALALSAFLASVVGQFASTRISAQHALRWGCAALIVGMVFVAVSLPAASLALLTIGAIVSGLGQGMSFRAGLGMVTAASPARQRGEITSAFFVTLYIAIAIPVVGEGAAATAFGLVTAGAVFAGGVAVLAAVVLLLLARD